MQGKGSGGGNFFVNYETCFDFHQNFAAMLSKREKVGSRMALLIKIEE
jgi:hypothetical protein